MTTQNAKQLDKKVAIVTGAGSGIGREVALQLAAAGAKVTVTDVDEKGGAAVVEEIKKAGGSAIFVKADASSPTDNEEIVKRTVKEFGGLHIAVNNAGIGGPSAPTGEYPLEGWKKVIDVNLSGVFYGMRYQLPAMEKSGGGSIVNIASILGQAGFRGSSAYVAAKHGVVGLTKAAALEYGQRGVRVNAVGPGFIKTPLLEKNLDGAAIKALEGMHPVGRLGEGREVSELVFFLASDAASFVTGSYYAVDGGYLAQ
jgi:NAD(P)-dependent dehydrogenase (short-subunit alcohol dehydrogenase family)